MEGDCDGMVAIVQGMMDAGLKVTMVDGRRGPKRAVHRPPDDVFAMPTSSQESNVRPILIRKRPSVSTSTERQAIMYKRNAGVQICDGRYASSYQMAHCKMVPTSPPVHLPEFPPQRAQPSSGLGNFEVGGCGSGENGYTPLIPVVPEVSYRNSFASPDRGCIRLRSPVASPHKHRHSNTYGDSPVQEFVGDTRNGLYQSTASYEGCSQSSPTEAFASSLRRYRPLSPDRSASSDLVQRLITYTQAKNLSKTASQLKSTRSLSRDRTPSPSGSCKRSPDRPTSKNVQTYTRTHEPPTRDRVQSDTLRKLRNSGAKDYCNVSQLNQTCDLRSPRPPRRSRSGNPEVMYLSNVTKVIRETLKQIYSEDKPLAVMQMCPSMMSRYNMHKSKYHKHSTGQQSNLEADVEMQVSPTVSQCVPLLRLSPATGSRPRKLCCLCHKPPPCACIITPIPDKPTCSCPRKDNDYGRLLEEQICAWLCEIPVYINDSPEDKLKRHAQVMKLAETLKAIDDEDFENKAREEILACIETLPMWYPGARRDQLLFKEQIANSLLDRIKDLPREQFDDNLLLGDRRDEEPKDFSNILGDDFEEISKFKTLEPAQAGTMRKTSADSAQRAKNESDDAISEWVQEVSAELGYNLNVDRPAVNSLVQSIRTLQKQDMSKPDVQKELKNIIRGWLDTATAGRGQLDSNTKAEFTEKLFNKLVVVDDPAKKTITEKIDDVFSGKANEVGETSERRFSVQSLEKNVRKVSNLASEKPESREVRRDSSDDTLIEEIWNLFGNISDAEKQDPVNKRLLKDLASKIKNVLLDDSKSSEEIHGDILGLLTIFFNKVNVSSKPKEDRIHKFLKSLKSSPKPRKRWASQDDLQKSILEAISELPLNEALRQLAPNDRKEVKNKTAYILANNISTLNTPDVSDTKSEVANVLVEDGLMQSFAAQKLAGDIIDRVRAMSILGVKKTSFGQSYQKPIGAAEGNLRSTASHLPAFAQMPSKTSLKQTLKREVSGTFQKHKLKIKDIAQLEDDITEVLSDQIMRGGSINTRAEVISLLQEADITHEKTVNVTNELVEKVRDLSAIITSDVDSKKYSLSKGAGALKVVNETQNTYHEPPLYVPMSTPNQTMESIILSDPLMSPIPAIISPDQSWNSKRTQNTDEKKYMDEIATIIAEWMDELPVDYNAAENKGFKETMVKDLAADIMDRQKYLQLNPSAKTSDIEELEHLKYQVFRWLNKLVDVADMTNIIPRTKILMDRIKGLRVPSLIRPKKEDALIQQGEIPHFSDVLEDEISSWLREVPPHMIKVDERHQQQVIKELAEKIQIDKHDKDFDVSREIEQWANRVITGNRRSIVKWSDLLKERLKNKGFAGDTSWILAQDTSQFIEENLSGGMLEWLKNSPLYQDKTPEERQQQETLLQELAREMRIVIDNARPGEDIDDLLMSEITKFLRKFPLSPEQRSDPEFLTRTAGELLQYLKGLQMFQDISVRHQAQPSDMQLVNIIEDWVGSLPINARKNSTEYKQFNTLKQEYICKLKELKIKHDPAGDNTDLHDEIKKYLLLLPIEPSKRQDQQFLDDKIEELLNNIDIISSKKPTNQVIDEAVFNWSKALPLKDGTTLASINSKLNEFSSALSKTLQNVDLSHFDEKCLNIKEDIMNFLRKLPLATSKQNHEAMNKLTNDLINAIKGESMRNDHSSEAKTAKKAADILYDNIESWCENLPIPCDDTPEDEEMIKAMKKNLASKLINKIGELNMNPELFNDDFLYEDLLQDEVDELLNPIPKDTEFESRIPELKRELIEKVIEANHKTREENAGHVYKQQLKDTISKALPVESELSSDDEATFELLKENVADAFINLHCIGGNEDLKHKYRSKINDEVEHFCNDYLKRNPNSPIDTKKVNKDLYKALRNVPLPNEESMRSEIGQARIKDEINEWMKDVPLKDQTGAEQLRTNKMVSVLAKKLHNIELDKAASPELDATEKMQTEIEKWMKKLPLRTESRVQLLATELVSNLQKSEDSRRFSASTQLSIDSLDDVDQICCRRTILEKQQRSFHGNRYNRRLLGVAQVPSSTLTCDDRAHLQRIRDRAKTIKVRPKTCRDVAICPLPIDASSQTEMRCLEEHDNRRQSDRMSLSSLQENTSQSAYHVPPPAYPRAILPGPCAVRTEYDSPQVVVKDHHWATAPKSTRYKDTPPLCVDPICPRPHLRPYTCKDAQSQNFIPQTCSTRAFTAPVNRHAPSRSPCTTQTYGPSGPCRTQTNSKQSCRAQNYASQPPCMSQGYDSRSPCLTQSYSPQPARLPQSSTLGVSRNDNNYSSTQKRSSTTSRDPFTPCFRPSRALMIDDDEIQEGPSRPHRPFVSERQSIEHANYRSSDSRNSRMEDYSVRFPKSNDQWNIPCRSPIASDEDTDRMRESRCVYRAPRCYRGRRRPSPDKSSYKCCGTHCPYPSHLYFRS